MTKSSEIVWLVVLAVLLSLVPGHCPAAISATPAGSASDLTAVKKVLAEIVAGDNAGNLDAVLSCYADDAILLPPNNAPVMGKSAIHSRYEDGFRHFRFDIAFTSDEAQVFGDWAFVRGTIQGRTVPKGNEPPRQINDKYIMVLRRQNSGWKIARLIWNSSDPTPKTSS